MSRCFEIDTSILAEAKLSERQLYELRGSGAAATLAVDDWVSNSEEQT
jgi:hypothetical protein